MTGAKIKNFFSRIFAIMLILGIVGSVIYISTSQTKAKISVFERGSINSSTGFLENNNYRMRTKEMFECQGLNIKLADGANFDYQVFYYDSKKFFVGATDVISGSYEKGEDFDVAKYARVLVIPDSAKDKTYLYTWNILELALSINISLLRDQTFVHPTIHFNENAESDFYLPSCDNGYYLVSPYANGFLVYDETVLGGKRIHKICLPIGSVVDYTVDSVLSLYIAYKKSNGKYSMVHEIELTIPKETLSKNYSDTDSGIISLDDVQWLEFEVDIELADKQTIIFGDDKDTAYIAHGYAYDLTDFVYYHIHSDDYSVSDRFWFSMDFVYDK